MERYLGLLELGDLGVDVLHALELHARLGALARLDGRVHLSHAYGQHVSFTRLQARDIQAICGRTHRSLPRQIITQDFYNDDHDDRNESKVLRCAKHISSMCKHQADM